MIGEAIDFRYLLIENYKKMNLTELETMTLFIIDHLIERGNSLITADLLSLKMTMSIEQIDKILADLLKKGMIDYVSDKSKTYTTLQPLKNKLYKEFQLSFAKEQTVMQKENIKESLDNIYATFQECLGRTLSPLEISKIREWISFGYSDETIIDALKEALSKKKKSFRSIDKILLNWASRNDVENEGHTLLSEKWHKNIEETIRIAQTPWVDKDDE